MTRSYYANTDAEAGALIADDYPALYAEYSRRATEQGARPTLAGFYDALERAGIAGADVRRQHLNGGYIQTIYILKIGEL